MKRYETYQEARTANPDLYIFRWNAANEFIAVTLSEFSAYNTTWTYCQPKLYEQAPQPEQKQKFL